MSDINRRNILKGAAAVMAAPLLMGSKQVFDVDVVIIGAGAAGIAAAKELRQHKLSFKVIEANNRIGGRIHTDHDIFGVPYDMGAHWLHNREKNPFADYGENNGFTIYQAPNHDLLRIGDRNATEAEYQDYQDALDKTYRALMKAGDAERDISPADVVPDVGTWNLSTHFAVGPYEMGKDFKDFSCKDWYSADDGTDYFCKEGLGQLFTHSATEIPVDLNIAAQKITWRDQGVTINTSKGKIRAKAVIITVSTGVLAAEKIQFDPPLPSKTQQAFHDLSMGHYTHVVLQLRENFFGIEEDGFFYYKIDQESNGSPKGFAALVNAAGTGLTYCDLGGNLAKELALAGNQTTLDFVIGELKRMYGSQVDKSLIKAHVSEWSTNPLTLGSYASAKPGKTTARKIIRKSVGDRIWFAGEAASPNEWSTVSGAHKSGLAAAKKIARKLS